VRHRLIVGRIIALFLLQRSLTSGLFDWIGTLCALLCRISFLGARMSLLFYRCSYVGFLMPGCPIPST